MAKEQPISVRLTPEQRAALERIAGEEDRSIGYLIRIAIDRYIEGREPQGFQ